MKTKDMTTGVVYCQRRGKYWRKKPVLMIDGRRLEMWRTPQYSSRPSTCLCVGRSTSAGKAGALFIDLSRYVDDDNDEPSFPEWGKPAIEHPAVSRALEATKDFVADLATLGDQDQAREFPHGTLPKGVEVFRPQNIHGPWEEVLQAEVEADARDLAASQAHSEKLDKARGGFQVARNTLGEAGLPATLSWDTHSVTMSRTAFIAMVESLKENKS